MTALYEERVARVRLLAALLQDEGIACEAWVGGRDEPHVKVWLVTEFPEDTHTHLAIGTDGPASGTVWAWTGQLQRAPFGQDWSDGLLEVTERPHMGHGVAEVAKAYANWCELLRLGTGEYLDSARMP